mgnify:CR=1 FL=1
MTGMKNTLQKRYEGFLKTPCLWKSDVIFNLMQFEIISTSSKIDIDIDQNLRLGKYIERFVSFELSQQKNIHVLAENIQIQQEKLTLGELDCLILKDEQPIHLEIIYKFYLYDDSVGTSEIDHFIGPNRKDALIEKLTKLKDKQLPLLHTNTCKTYLNTFDLKAETIKQQVYFKAQLFLPFSNQNMQLQHLNNNCVIGFYFTKSELTTFKSCKFYIPTKKDWLLIPHTNVSWLNFEEICTISNSYITQQYSALLWIKFKNGTLKKVFFVWW